MKLLLTGGTGFLGKNVARALAGAGHELRLLARAKSNLDGLPRDVEIARGDVTDLASLRSAAPGCGAVFHMAALVKTWVSDPSAYERVNVGGLRNVLQVAEETGARVVYTSSFFAVGPAGPEPADESRRHPGGARTAYERTKAEADGVALEAAAKGRDLVLLYPGAIYGPGEMTEGNYIARMAADHLNGRFPGYLGAGDRLLSYSFVEDVSAGHLAALEKGKKGERYFLCGDNRTQVQLMETLSGIAGIAPPKRHIPFAVASLLGGVLLAWAELTGYPPLLTPAVVNTFKEHWAYSSAKAERELGYRITPLETGLRRTLEWLRTEGHLS
jgi:farnesol dehydrogenase